MLSLRVIASGSSSSKASRRKRVVDTRKADLKAIRNQLNSISKDERKRLKEMWKMHTNFFVDDETMDVIVMSEKSIDEYFDN